MSHLPDFTKIPKPLQCLEWQENEEDLVWQNGQTLLVAIPICDDPRSNNWHYEFHIIQICCDEHYFGVINSDKDQWVWDMDDFDWYITIRA